MRNARKDGGPPAGISCQLERLAVCGSLTLVDMLAPWQPASSGRPDRVVPPFCCSQRECQHIMPARARKFKLGCGYTAWGLQVKARVSVQGPSRQDQRKRETLGFMDSHELIQLLDAVASGELPTADAARRIRTEPFVDAGGFAKVDLHRRLRCGFPEVVFGQGKTAPQIETILRTLLEHGQGGLVTRLDPGVAAHLKLAFPAGEHNELGRTFHIPGPAPAELLGRVVIITAGTSDLPVAEEARVTAEAWSCEVALIADVGVAGLHRLLHQLDRLEDADALVVVAGMEGALPSVVGGLVDCPVIAVPTSIGYGAHFHGLAALLGMLNSCASNVVVVNIDAGFSGGHVAGLIARRAGLARLSAGASRAASKQPKPFSSNPTLGTRTNAENE